MVDVMVALVPALAMGVFMFGVRVLVLAAISVASCVLFEFLYQMCIRDRPKAKLVDLNMTALARGMECV